MSDLDVRDKVLELASLYETVAALDATAATDGVRTKPGSRVPPGAQEMLDADEVTRALTEVDEWAEFCAHVLVDELDVTAPDETPRRLRLVAQHIGHFVWHDEFLIACDFGPAGQLEDLQGTMRRIARRGVRVVQTGRRCDEPGCTGRLVSPLGDGSDRHDAALVCSAAPHHVVPWSVWSSWPRMRVQWITVEHAAKMLRTTVPAVKMRASRGKWRKVGTGRDVRYSVEDVRAAEGVSA